MPQSAIFPFSRAVIAVWRRVMVGIFNQARVDLVAIRNVQEAFPALNLLPEPAKCFKGAVAHNELEDAWQLRIYDRKQPNFVFLCPTKVWSSSI